MTFFKLPLIAALLMTSAAFIPAAQAADEFGARFTGNTPVALQDTTSADVNVAADAEMSAEQLNEVAPAAGGTAAGVDGVTPTSDNIVGQELGEQLGAPVSHTELDRSGDQSQHNSIGDGDVGVFYQNNSNDRIKDTDDSVGIELRLLKFE